MRWYDGPPLRWKCSARNWCVAVRWLLNLAPAPMLLLQKRPRELAEDIIRELAFLGILPDDLHDESAVAAKIHANIEKIRVLIAERCH